MWFVRQIIIMGGVVVAGALPAVNAASQAQATVPLPPIRQLGRRVALTSDSLASVTSIRAMGDGRVFVVDGISRRLLLYDSTLTHAKIVADSTPDTKKAFGASKYAAVMPYRGDTTVLVVPASIGLLMIDPRGQIVRTIAPPETKDVGSLVSVGTYGGGGAFDAAGHLVYRPTSVEVDDSHLAMPMWPPTTASLRLRTGSREGSPDVSPPAPKATTVGVVAPGKLGNWRDSAFLLRGDFGTRATDTIAYLVRPLGFRHTPGGRDTTFVDPVPLSDEWAVTSDGSVAIVRALDYHIDWINPDGTRSSTPRVAHDWGVRLTDSTKGVLADSARRVVTAWRDSSDSVARAQARAHGFATTGLEIPPFEIIDPADMVDYWPAFGAGAVKADGDNNLWIRQGWAPPPPPVGAPTLWWVPPTAFAAKGPEVYDVVNRQGQLVDRVELPPSLSLVGFGPGVVYLTSREAFGVVVVKYRVR